MLSAVIPSRRSYPTLQRAPQLAHQRSVHSGPLVLGAAPRKSHTPTADRDRPVSRRSEPSSRTALMGEQPNPWDLVVDVNSWTRLACYPRGSFYPVSYGLSTQRRRITKPDFRPCSARRPGSQAPLCLYTQRLVSIQPEGTFGRLRYSFAGDRPSQTAHLPPSPSRLTGRG
jgi:hypothetical protein